MIFKLGSLILFFAFNFHVEAGNAITNDATGVNFPAEVTFTYLEKDYRLDATGVSVRKKLFFKVYSVAHYLQKVAASQGDRIQDVMSDANAHQLKIKWLRDEDALDIQRGYEELLMNTHPSPVNNRLRAAIRSFVAIFHQSIVEGEEHVIRWIPGGINEVFINGKAAGKITNSELAKGLWSIWFGPESIVNREDLISLMK